jgi:hypothetical protein
MTGSAVYYQIGVILGGIFFTAFVMSLLDAMFDGLQTRVLAEAKEDGRAPSSDDIETLAITSGIKHAAVLLLVGGLCLYLELREWHRLASPAVLLALFGRNVYLLFDAVLCLLSRSRLPRGLPKSVYPQ